MERLSDVVGSSEPGVAPDFHLTPAFVAALAAEAASWSRQAGLDMDRIDAALAAPQGAGQDAEN
jgi:hypothetical protein